MPDPTAAEIVSSLRDAVAVDGEDLVLGDKKKFREKHLDRLVYLSVFHSDPETRTFLRWLIRSLAQATGVVPGSIFQFYRLKGEGKFPKITVPAVNIRGLTYDTARALVRAARANNSMSFAFEIAPSEMAYTDQAPDEYATVVMAAALREQWSGPVFIQGDHCQFKPPAYATDPTAEIERIQSIVRSAVEAGFFNIDIDASTLVDLQKSMLEDQQRTNCEITAAMTRFVRSIQPEGIEISVGGEIGEVGGKNSTTDELRTFMDGYIRALAKTETEKIQGLSKISVQTGTVHGGIPLPDGTVAEVSIDFQTLEQLGTMARTTYGVGGVVQHGASTLPEILFERFPQADTAEIHLATAFQNIVFDGGHFPRDFYGEIAEHLKRNYSKEWLEGETEEQFLYKTRKRAFGTFKRRMWDLSAEIRGAISADLEKRFDLIFKKLGAINTIDAIVDNVQTLKVTPALPAKFQLLLKR